MIPADLEAQCSGCKKFFLLKDTVPGFQFPPYYMGPQHLCKNCAGKLFTFMIRLHGDK